MFIHKYSCQLTRSPERKRLSSGSGSVGGGSRCARGESVRRARVKDRAAAGGAGAAAKGRQRKAVEAAAAARTADAAYCLAYILGVLGCATDEKRKTQNGGNYRNSGSSASQRASSSSSSSSSQLRPSKRAHLGLLVLLPSAPLALWHLGRLHLPRKPRGRAMRVLCCCPRLALIVRVLPPLLLLRKRPAECVCVCVCVRVCVCVCVCV